MSREYHFENYNPDWVLKFNKIRDFISSVFKEKVITIEHVGSTSIQGMRSKPVIDVVVVLEPFIISPDEKLILEKSGYFLSENKIGEGTAILEGGIESEKNENIHLLPMGHNLIDQMVLSRDYLISHPERMEAYGKLKDVLKGKYPNDYRSYRDGKEDFMKETERLARKEYGRS